ncbi:MAG: 3-hydroxybutyryl-CoA dehydrogenase [Dehalococcoidia bacterium]|nr:3-hydroxybutyryl-CoA dehydrogenase [Dehalococcoidia bacterium]
MEIRKVGVVGTGVMGSGAAQLCAESSYHTIMQGRTAESLARGMKNIQATLDKQVARGRTTPQQKEAALSRLQTTTRLEDLAECDIVIEAIVEDLEEKRKVFAVLDRICPRHTILASDTATLPIVRIATATKRPERVVGMHILSPAPASKALELVRSVLSSDETVETARKFGESLGKRVIMAKDTPGFIINRLLAPYLLDAIRVYESGVAPKEDIDQAMALGCGHPLGPLSLVDAVGLDQFCDLADALYEAFRDPRFSPPPLLRQMVAAGYLGRKNGKGFYEYK